VTTVSPSDVATGCEYAPDVNVTTVPSGAGIDRVAYTSYPSFGATPFFEKVTARDGTGGTHDSTQALPFQAFTFLDCTQADPFHTCTFFASTHADPFQISSATQPP
jgi:hypothetical protein